MPLTTRLETGWLDVDPFHRLWRWLKHAPARLVLALGPRAAHPLVVRSCSDHHLHGPAELAALPQQARLEDAEGVTLLLTMPGAGRNNTEIVWNADEQRLSVAVWARRARADQQGERRPGRIRWYASFWLPQYDGGQAAASVARGRVMVRVPSLAAAWERLLAPG